MWPPLGEAGASEQAGAPTPWIPQSHPKTELASLPTPGFFFIHQQQWAPASHLPALGQVGCRAPERELRSPRRSLGRAPTLTWEGSVQMQVEAHRLCVGMPGLQAQWVLLNSGSAELSRKPGRCGRDVPQARPC